MDTVTYTDEGEIQIPLVLGMPGAINLGDPEVREEFNDSLWDLVNTSIPDPTHTFDKVSDVLLAAGYEIPIFDKFVDDTKEVIIGLLASEEDDPVFLYFGYSSVDGPYEVLVEIVSEGELDDLLAGE